jgi:hypothetical protein
METLTAFSTALGLGIGAGINTYATLLVLGLIARLRPALLPSSLAHTFGSTTVLVIVGVMYLIEFAADKIPAVDHVWDVIHTFIRPLAGAVVALAAARVDLPRPILVAAVLIGGGSALAAHATKASVRAVSTLTTGGMANPILSLAEDFFAFGGSAVAIFLPLLGLALLAFLALPLILVLRRRRGVE